jgi:DNA helicase-2/ATP-dependent DNA helicase PcrA
MEEDIFPHKLSIDTEEGIEEERRLCYVGITRAKEKLFITSAELRRSYYGVEYKQPSRFISELPEEEIEFKQIFSDDFKNNARYASSASYTKEDEGIQAVHTIGKYSSEESTHSDSKFKVRDKLIHPKFGLGTVIKIEGSGDNVKLTILFGSTKKIFMEKYTPLEKAD